MKYRVGFVSNSSSSSFICACSGEVSSGWDMTLSDAEMYQCEKGHTFGQDYLIDDDESDTENLLKIINEGIDAYTEAYKDSIYSYCVEEEIKEDFDCIVEAFKNDGISTALETMKEIHEEKGDDGYVSSKQCPICQMEYFIKDEVLAYILLVSGKSLKEVQSEIKAKFSGNYEDFKSAITGVI